MIAYQRAQTFALHIPRLRGAIWAPSLLQWCGSSSKPISVSGTRVGSKNPTNGVSSHTRKTRCGAQGDWETVLKTALRTDLENHLGKPT